MTQPEIHVYLAGPDVFEPDALALGQAKKAFLSSLGMIGHYPFDNELPPEAQADPRRAARLIAETNERMILDCCKPGRFGAVLANMTPFHGPSMDVGTAFEVGFMAALSHSAPNVLIAGYTSDHRLFEDRVAADVYGGRVEKRDGRLIGADGRSLEAFGGVENLMITAAIERTGGCVSANFEDAARFIQREIARRMEADSSH